MSPEYAAPGRRTGGILMHRRTAIDGLDSELMDPGRLLVATMLAEMQWQEFTAICDALDLTAPALSGRPAALHRAGYLETRRHGRRSSWRLTPLGFERLVEHLDAIHAVVTKAGEILAALRA
jgi:DNA-binding MarR family transcriptional regulator